MSVVDREGTKWTELVETLLLVLAVVIIWQVSFEAVVVVLLVMILYELRS